MDETSNLQSIVFSIISLFVLLGGFIIVFVIKYRQKQVEFEQEKKRIRLLQENELIKAQLEISEELMKNISHEIHDNIGQSLSLAKLTLHGLTDLNYKEQTGSTFEILTRAIGDLRNLSKSLNGNFIRDIGLIESIRREVNLINSTGKVKCTLEVSEDEFQLPDNQAIILFRCAQEAINNCIKHSGALELNISCSSENGLFRMIIKDNGQGFNLDDINRNGIGMSSMRDRARLLGGIFDIKSTPKGGTCVTFEIPTSLQHLSANHL
jgi:two-component system NarL family sensor kinase